MKIKRLVIENFKSIERIELIEPNPFTVFVGPNGSGKSNIFEALEFVNSWNKTDPREVSRLYGGSSAIANRNHENEYLSFNIDFDGLATWLKVDSSLSKYEFNGFLQYPERWSAKSPVTGQYHANEQFLLRFTRLFVGNLKPNKFNYQDDVSLNTSASNLEPVLKRILSEKILKNEIFEWLEMFVPEFKAVDVSTNSFDGRDVLLWFEQFSDKAFTKELISDGTYNILAMLAAVYQSDDKPQFLCIEEPENGLHPQVARELVDFFRIMCEERGHYIWLNTHSQSMASRVRPEEFVVVEKKQGATIARQFKKDDFHGMRADEAWLTNALNGGLAW